MKNDQKCHGLNGGKCVEQGGSQDSNLSKVSSKPRGKWVGHSLPIQHLTGVSMA